MSTYQVPEVLAPQYQGAGWALAAITTGGLLIKIVYLADVSPSFAECTQLPNFDQHAAFFVRQHIGLPELGPTVRMLQALGEVSVGMLGSWEFTEL
jgi:hypothetical protein